jgi:hypothetical protein
MVSVCESNMTHHLPFKRITNTENSAIQYEIPMFDLQKYSKYASPKLQLNDLLSQVCFPWAIC